MFPIAAILVLRAVHATARGTPLQLSEAPRLRRALCPSDAQKQVQEKYLTQPDEPFHSLRV